jgi:hypothetical protein
MKQRLQRRSERPGVTIIKSFIRALVLLASGRVHVLRADIGRTLTMEDGEEFTIFRHVRITASGEPAGVFIVRFTPARMSVRQNIRFSLLPMIPLLGMHGFREKYWCVNEQTGMCQGVYAWQTRADAEAYARSLALRFMTNRSLPGTVSYRLIEHPAGGLLPSRWKGMTTAAREHEAEAAIP